MRTIPWLKLGAVGALWTIIAGAGVSGWMIGKTEAAREYSELQRRINAGSTPNGACGIEVELLDSPERGAVPPETPPASGPTQISAPAGYLHLRELLTAR